MTIASEITRINNNIADAYTAASGKGATLPATQNSANLATCIGSISAGGGEFQLTRFKDDTNTEIGTHICNFTDANNTTYKVILLDAVYRNASTKWSNDTTDAAVPNLPVYDNLATSNVWKAKETATFNTQKILDFCSSGGYTSTACSHCRSQSFVIDGVTYYGQLPNIIEANEIAKHYDTIESMDDTASSNPSKNFSDGRIIWSSTQFGQTIYYAYVQGGSGVVSVNARTSDNFACPVLEIPLS